VVGRPTGRKIEETWLAVRYNRFLYESDPIAFQNKTRQSSGRVGTRIDIYSVGPHVRLHDGRMSMHDNFAEVVLARQKILPDPEEVVF
jgi:hypothetical protein